nr:hypothetical protein B0A51_07792 [Rachicladosporium sp. CCFEE 5018]
MRVAAFVTALAGYIAATGANECTLNTCDVDPVCGIEACQETGGMQTLTFYFCCAAPGGNERPPGGPNTCPGCSGSKMIRRWADISNLQADEAEKRDLEAVTKRSHAKDFTV